jgi:DNA-binding transcriptional LysR family regulator
VSSRALPLDLPLLLELQQLLATRSVTETARRSGSTQPAVSRSLARLRAVFGDPLLVRVGRQLEPTGFARELAPRVDAAIAAMSELLEPAAAFDPARGRWTLTLAASDYATTAFLGPFFARLRSQAPHLDLRVIPAGAATVGALARGEVELVLGTRAPIDGVDGLVMRPFARDALVCAMRRDHPASGRRLTLRRYLSLDHVVVASDCAAPSAVDAELRRLGASRRVPLALPSFGAAMAALAQTDALGVLPARLVATSPALVARALPFDLEPLALHVGWHPRRTTDARHRWARELLLDCAPR